MRRLCFVIAYFGHLPNYFPLFLKTCESNPEFDWKVFTDDATPYPYPENVQRVAMTWEQCQKYVRSRFDCPVAIDRPYKLCDLKPMYGYIFEEYLQGYRYWGHCDLDTIMGNLGHFLTDEFLEQYDKVFCLGHMTLYRNTQENNRVFMSEHLGDLPYRKVLANPQNCWFDEEWNNPSNVNQIFLSYQRNVFQQDLSLNVSFLYNDFRRIKYVGYDHPTDFFGYEEEPFREALYLWIRGSICRFSLDGERLSCEEFPYMHLQQRPMNLQAEVLKADTFQIVPDEFRTLPELERVKAPEDMTLLLYNKVDKKGNSHQKRRLFFKRLKRFLKKLFSTHA